MRTPLARAALLYLLAAILLAGCSTEEERTTVTHVRVLSNGATVYAHENRASDVVSVQAWVRDGALFESADEAGMAYLLASAMFDQSEARSAGEVKVSIEKLGGSISPMCRHDYAQHMVVVPAMHFDTAAEILVEGFRNPVFDPARVERVKERIVRDLPSLERRWMDQAYLLCLEELFGEHPYSRLPQGDPATLAGITAEDLAARHRDRYVAQNLVMVVSGSVAAPEAADRIEDLVSSMEPGERAEPAAEPITWPVASRRRIERADVTKAYQVAAFPGPSVTDEDSITMDVLLIVLERGRSSRLNRIVREEHGLVQSIGAGWYTQLHPSPLFVWMEASPEKIEEAEEAVVEVLGTLAEEPVSERELEKAKTILEAATLFDHETAEMQAFYYGYWSSIGGIEFADQYFDRLQEVTAEEIREAAARHFSSGVHVTAAIIPE
jgi:predicted Zn-dependent peptidase